MSAFDGFIEDNDRDLQMDTSVRLEGDVRSPSNGGTPGQKSGSQSYRSPVIQPQVTPAKPSDQDHPLKDTPTRANTNGKMTRSNTLKRLSIIQPMMSPESLSKEHRQQQASRTRSRSIISGHSRSSSSASEQQAESSKDVGAVLQLLANKELELLETKRKIDELKKTLSQEEKALQLQTQELQELKGKVGRALNSGIDEQLQLQQHHQQNPHNSQQAHKHYNLQQQQQQQQQNQNGQPHYPNPAPGVPKGQLETRRMHSKKESMWTRPLSFLNQFDQLIQHELEKKLNWDDVASPEKTPTSETPGNKPAEDVFGNVSSSLWNFVSDVKTGLLGINEEGEEGITEGSSNSRAGDSKNQLKFVSDAGGEVELKDYNRDRKQQ